MLFYLYWCCTKNTNYYGSFLICLGGTRGVLNFSGACTHIHIDKWTDTCTQTCSVYTHSHSWIAHTEALSQCLPDAVVFHFPPTSLSSLTAEINEFIAPSFTYKDTESFTDPRANIESTYSEVSSSSSPLFSVSHSYIPTSQRYICACMHVLEWSSVTDEIKTFLYMNVYLCVCHKTT